MFKKLFERFRSKPKVFVVEVEKPRKLPTFDDNIRASVAILADQPGFVYLLAKHRFIHDTLKRQLETAKHEKLDDVAYLQHGLFWSRWLENELNLAVNRKPARSEVKDPVQEELEAFNEANRMIELVGSQ